MKTDEREKYIISRIQTIQEEYKKAIQPYVKQLVEIRLMRPPSIIISKEHADQVLKELAHK